MRLLWPEEVSEEWQMLAVGDGAGVSGSGKAEGCGQAPILSQTYSSESPAEVGTRPGAAAP